VLFGGLSFWAALQIVFINKRDGQWTKPDSVPFLKDIITVLVAIAVFAGLLYLHESLFGVAPIPT
jgi:hypothetical protein